MAPWTVRLIPTIALVAAGTAKLRRPSSAAKQLSAVVGVELTRSVAVTLSLIELGLATLFVATPENPGIALTGLALMLVFTAGIALVLRRGVAVACACFGGLSSDVTAVTAVRNVLLTTLCAAAALYPASWEVPHQEIAGALIVAASIVAAWNLSGAITTLRTGQDLLHEAIDWDLAASHRTAGPRT